MKNFQLIFILYENKTDENGLRLFRLLLLILPFE